MAAARSRRSREGVQTIARAYERVGAADKFSYFIEEGAGHVLSDRMWKLARDWFQKHLRA